MKIVKGISSEDVLTIDIETVRYKQKFSELSEAWKSAWSYKNKHEGETLSEEELSVKWEKTASLYAEFSKVCAISLVYLKDGILKCKSYSGTDEKKILIDFAKDLKAFYSTNKSYRILGHAVKYFDIPFLCKRYVAQRMDIPVELDESSAKPWEMRNIDTNEMWKSFGTGAGSSLQALCTLLGVPISKVDLVGDEVGKAYFNSELDRISKYCALDSIATFNVFRRFKSESIFAFDDVIYVSEAQTVA